MEADHFLPFRVHTVIALCARELPVDEAAEFGAFARLLVALVHHDHHARGDAILDAYQVIDPAEDVRVLGTPTAADRAAARATVERELLALAESADFTRIEADEIERAFTEHSLLKVRLQRDDTGIETVLFFRRGVAQRTETIRQWFGLRRRTIEFTSYSKVLVYVAFAENPETDGEHPGGEVLLKLFQDVPRNDLEMLYPRVRVGMRPVDKMLIGVPAVVSGIAVLVTKLIGSLGLLILLLAFWIGLREEPVDLDRAALVTLGAGAVAFGGYLVRQLAKFKNRKMEMMKTLSEHLYFRNLGNDYGVFHHLLAAAEESETKEAVLAYHFLRTTEHPLTAAALDRRVEDWFGSRWATSFDFPVRSGVRTLRRLGLVTEDSAGALHAVDLGTAVDVLDRHWDDRFPTRTGTRPPRPAGPVWPAPAVSAE